METRQTRPNPKETIMKHLAILALAAFCSWINACDRDGKTDQPTDDVQRKISDDSGEGAFLPEPSIGDALSTTSTGIVENDFKSTTEAPLSTFSIDVDTASYALARRYIESKQRPPVDAVRLEEFINYFEYDYASPGPDAPPFAVHTEVATAPWESAHRLVRIGLKGRVMAAESRPAANLVFLIDVSGSMAEPSKLPLVKTALRMLVEQLTAADRVGIVTYAGNAGIALMPTPGDQRETILAAIDGLGAEGSTNGEGGINSAYSLATANMVQDGINRVVLCTDGDFNVGQTNSQALVDLIRSKAEGGISLTALGFGMRIHDAMLETLADKGDGNYGYIDRESEARRLLVENVMGTLVTIAKDVKIQVAFSPAVKRYRLLGYENRRLEDDEFDDDTKDAGEIGSGHTVTALYQVELADGVDPQAAPVDLMTVNLRWKQPKETTSQETSTVVQDSGATLEAASSDWRFAAAAAGFAMLLRDSTHKGGATWDSVKALASAALGADLRGLRAEMVGLIDKAATTAP